MGDSRCGCARRLACGDVGVGAMAEVVDVAAAVRVLVDALQLRGGDGDDGARAAAELDAAP